MKKNLMSLSILFVCLLVLTGCGSTKTLTCTQTETDDETTTTTKIVGKYDKDGNCKTISSTMTMDLGSGNEDTATTYKTYMDLMFSSYEDVDGVEYSSEVDGTKIIMTISVDASKLDDDAKEDLEDAIISYDDAKASYEDDGYTCK